jgi:aminopeptidase
MNMVDPRVTELAKVLVDYSCKVKKGEVVAITAIGVETLPLVKELQKACLERGVKHVEYEFIDPEIEKDFLNLASDEQIAHFPQHKMDFMKQVDCYIAVRAQENSMLLANANLKNIKTRSKVMYPILEQRVEHTRWVVTRWPTHGAAQDAKMSRDEFEDFFFAATIYDYETLKKRQEKLRKLMEKTDKVRLKASDTDLTFSIKGLPAISCFGDRNIPDGEVFTAPVRDSINGYIKYNTPSIQNGREFSGVRLEIQNGKIVKAECGGLTKELNEVFDTDEGARYFGEFAVGTNPNIRQAMRNILFDEKIFGSIHLTPGMAYGECDNGNKSAVHWDLVKILVGDGDLFFDGKLIQHNGYFVHKDLLDLNPPAERKLAEKFLAGKKK